MREIMTQQAKLKLLEAARQAAKRAVAPYSKFRVGAALLTADGKIITGANVESVSFGLTCCAERIALFKALTDGYGDFVAIAVVAPLPKGATPCGACRQLLVEYAGEAAVLVGSHSAKRFREFTVKGLQPQAFEKLKK